MAGDVAVGRWGEEDGRHEMMSAALMKLGRQGSDREVEAVDAAEEESVGLVWGGLDERALASKGKWLCLGCGYTATMIVAEKLEQARLIGGGSMVEGIVMVLGPGNPGEGYLLNPHPGAILAAAAGSEDVVVDGAAVAEGVGELGVGVVADGFGVLNYFPAVVLEIVDLP